MKLQDAADLVFSYKEACLAAPTDFWEVLMTGRASQFDAPEPDQLKDSLYLVRHKAKWQGLPVVGVTANSSSNTENGEWTRRTTTKQVRAGSWLGSCCAAKGARARGGQAAGYYYKSPKEICSQVASADFGGV